jgi:hypothetical protein
LRNGFLISTSRNLIIYRELAEILKALQPAGIPVTLLKGVYLAKWIYPEIALRPMSDIDLLVHRDDLSRAASILQGLGYQYGRAFNLKREARQHQHIPALWQTGKAPVELHWHIATPGSSLVVDLEGLWARTQPVDVAGAPAQVLSPEDFLLHLSFHLLQEEFIRGLKRLYDIATLTSILGQRIDWLQLQSRSREWNFRKGLFLVLHLAKTLLNAPVPESALGQLSPSDFTPQIDALAKERVMSADRSLPVLDPNLTRLRRRRPLRVKAKVLLSIIFPYPEYLAAKLSLPPGSKVGLSHHLVWIKYLVSRYGWQFWHVMRNDDTAAALAQNENSISDWWIAR